MAPNILLLDIEGTTTSISFVKETLFPYVLKTLSEYLNNNWNSILLNEDIELLRSDALNEHKNGNLEIPLIPDRIINNDDEKSNNDEEIKQAIIENIEYQMKIDRKSHSLKNIQGHIWQIGYKDNLKGHVYQDVPLAFKRWTQSGLCLYIYSSGSIDAQKLLFKHTNYGDLLTYISGHFDTNNIGSKVDSLSYTKILKELNTNRENVLFLTDILKEANACKSAGIECVLVLRPGNHPIESNEMKMFKCINTFDELDEIYFKKDKQ